MSIRSDNTILQKEWQALAKTEDVLLYNKKEHKLESMAYKNGFEKFFKTIWFYMRGYTKDTDILFKGIEDLLSRSVTRTDLQGESTGNIFNTIQKVHDVTMIRMISKFKEQKEIAKSLAAQLLNKGVEDFLRGNPGGTTLTPGMPLAPNGSPLSPPPAGGPTPPPGPGGPLSVGGPPPPPPIMKSPEQIKKEKIAKVKKEIEVEKQLVKYLELEGLKAHKHYKKYASEKGSLEIFKGKAKEHEEKLKGKSPKALKKAIDNIEEQLKNIGDKTTVEIKQDGKPTSYDISVVREALEQWKKLHKEILDTNKKIKEFSSKMDEAAKKVIKQDGFKLSCKEIDTQIAKYQAAIPEPIKKNNGLNFHQSTLFNKENNLRKLQGKKIVKKKGQSSAKSKPKAAAEKKGLDQAAFNGIAGIAAKIIADKANAKPSLSRLLASLSVS